MTRNVEIDCYTDYTADFSGKILAIFGYIIRIEHPSNLKGQTMEMDRDDIMPIVKKSLMSLNNLALKARVR